MAVRGHEPRANRQVIFLLPALLLALGFLTGDASAGTPPTARAAVPHGAHGPHGASTLPPNDAFMALVPQGSAPPSGGDVYTGDRFVLELWLNAGSHTDVVAHQSYLSFPYDLIKNARVDQITTTCTLSDQFTPDVTTLEAVLQNEVCNGPGWCQRIAPPGTMSYASGTFNQSGVGGLFRVAQIGLCAIAPGQATLHWQFSPPEPPTRDTEIIDSQGNMIHNPALFTDYVVNILPGPTITPTPTPTAYCGPGWRSIASPNAGDYDSYLNAISVLSPNDIWAVGYYTDTPNHNQTLTMHWDGTQWSIVPSPNPGSASNQLQAVAALSSNEAWAVGIYSPFYNAWHALIMHWDGTQWSVVPAPDPGSNTGLSGIDAVSAADIWAVGGAASQTLTMHWDGTQWTRVPSPNNGTRPNDLHTVATTSANDAWAVGSYVNSEGHTLTLTMHWDGTQWTIVPSPNVPSTNGLLTSVATTSANDAWAVGYYQGGGTPWQTLAMRWDGAQWTIVATPNAPNSSSSYLLGVHAQPASEVWAVGYYYTATPFHAHTLALRWDGSQWIVSPSLDIGDDNQFQVVAALASNDIWAVGSSSFIGLDRTHYKTLVERNSDPCATPTATPTATSTPALLVGHVEWQGRPPQPDSRQQVPITLTLKMGGTEVNYPSQTTDTSGFFTVSVAGLPGGTYAWRAKGFYTPAQTGPAFLANSGALTLTGSPVTSAEMGLMRAGDADNDNTVNVTDYTILRASFGHQRCPPICDYRSDFNGDGIFTIIDFALLKSNFGQSGAPPIGPIRGLSEPPGPMAGRWLDTRSSIPAPLLRCYPA